MASRIPNYPLFDLVSYGRHGPGRRDHLTPAQVQQIARTVGRTSEVMVKVLPRGANNLGTVRRHVDYIGRKGKVDLETDVGQALRSKQTGEELLKDWDLELDALRDRAGLGPQATQGTSRLVHKLMFSMPAGTPPPKVFQAVQNFCREEFALQHRYAMALHTDEPHPHVHVVLKAVSEQGERLHIRKETLRHWREQFAQHLRALGVRANATPRYIRGESKPRKPDGIYRASLRGASTHMRARAQSAAKALTEVPGPAEAGKARLVQTRENVRQAWWALGSILVKDNEPELARQVQEFAADLPPAMTEREWLTSRLVQSLRASRDSPEPPGRS